jgi:hypothetical protein
VGRVDLEVQVNKYSMKYVIYTFIFIFLSSCYKTPAPFTPLKIDNPKEVINNTSGWTVSKYTEADKDSTILLSKYWVSFNEDPTCAERVKFIHPLSEVWAVWDIIQYADGTVINFWIPPGNRVVNIHGEWYFNELSKNKIHLYRITQSGEEQQLILNK